MSEGWVSTNQFCPSCGQSNLTALTANRPVADFICCNCDEQFELKAFRGPTKRKIVDGSYQTMISRLASDKNPNFLFLSYEREGLTVTDLQVIPKQFLTQRSIEPRKPLSVNARRAGWQGCNILMDTIPNSGRIDLVKRSIFSDRKIVLSAWSNLKFIRQSGQTDRAWLLVVMACCEQIARSEFKLEDVYAFESKMQLMYPNNNNVRAKIRQQLQVLRDQGFLDFVSRGRYRRTSKLT